MRLIDVLHDERGFIHKKLFSLGKGLVTKIAPSFIPGGSIVRQAIQTGIGLVSSRLGGRFPIRTRGGQVFQPAQVPLAITTARPTPSRSLTARVTPMSQSQIQFGLTTKFGNGDGLIPDILDEARRRLGLGNGNGDCPPITCKPPLVDRGRCFCEFPGGPSGGTGEFLQGRYGPAVEPEFRTVNVRDCAPGQILGKDFLCYNKGAISNKERLYPRGTRPLLTGGEMRAINKASRAESKVRTTALRLGILAAAPRKKRTPAGHKAKLVHA